MALSPATRQNCFHYYSIPSYSTNETLLNALAPPWLLTGVDRATSCLNCLVCYSLVINRTVVTMSSWRPSIHLDSDPYPNSDSYLQHLLPRQWPRLTAAWKMKYHSVQTAFTSVCQPWPCMKTVFESGSDVRVGETCLPCLGSWCSSGLYWVDSDNQMLLHWAYTWYY